MRLIVEPEDGIHPLLRAIKSARQCIDIAVFRCDIEALIHRVFERDGAKTDQAGTDR